MKRIILFVLILLGVNSLSNAQSSYAMANFERYAEKNKSLEGKDINVVFIGNSITQSWAEMRPDFFALNNYVGRGIGGQNSHQLLLRFRRDVLELKPKAVVINIGTNDIAGSVKGYYPQFILDNIKSMAELAQANGIEPVLSSITPVGSYPWSPDVKEVPQKIDALNDEIKAYAHQKGYAYIDYNTLMRKSDGSMIDTFTSDGVHVTPAGYEVMEQAARKVIEKLLGK